MMYAQVFPKQGPAEGETKRSSKGWNGRPEYCQTVGSYVVNELPERFARIASPVDNYITRQEQIWWSSRCRVPWRTRQRS